MNDEEIKEILNELQRRNDRYNYFIKEDVSFSDEDYQAHLLLDYITNLQQENERVNQYIDFYKDLIEKQNKSLEDYKSRNEKALKYVRETRLPISMANDLLNILQGSENN